MSYLQAGRSAVDKSMEIEHLRQREARPVKPSEQEKFIKKIVYGTVQ
jgi:hypothetical protein